jgi:hypothetical protein
MLVVKMIMDIVNDINPNRSFNNYPGFAARFMR